MDGLAILLTIAAFLPLFDMSVLEEVYSENPELKPSPM